jgi:hypothetical protein
VARRGVTYRALVALTALMKVDVVLFGRIPSGPFFALLRKTGHATSTDALPEGRAGSADPALTAGAEGETSLPDLKVRAHSPDLKVRPTY